MYFDVMAAAFRINRESNLANALLYKPELTA
jgi:hypothetical protein